MASESTPERPGAMAPGGITSPARTAAAIRGQAAPPLIQSGAAELGRQIARREVTSREVVEALIARIEAVDDRLGAVVVRRFDQARQEADFADDRVRRGEPLPPLWGVPITVKECYEVAGTAATIGLTARRSEIATADGEMVRRLKQAGAIVLGKTNVPQLMLGHECDNPVYGRTNNPWKLERTPGGSSGGEAAIIAAYGSPLGLANDMGGSIRLPAHFCGVHGIKPTNQRFPRSGSIPNLRGMEAIQYQPGGLARRVEDLHLCLQALAAPGPRRPCEFDAPPGPLPDPAAVRLEGLRIAAWEDDGYFSAAPALRRAVREAAAALTDRGAQIEWITPPAVDEAMRLYFGLVGADGGADARRLLEGSEMGWRLRRLQRLSGVPNVLRTPLAGALRWTGQPLMADLLSSARPRSADGFWRLTWRMKEYVLNFMQLLERGKFDAMLTPPHALPAMQHDKAIDLFPAASYTFLPNLLRVPVGVVACTRVRPEEETDRPASRDLVQRRAREVELGSAGLPVGVQVAAWHWREDVVLALMQALEDSFAGREDYPKLAM